MELNDIVVCDGRRYIVVGFDPMCVRPQRVYVRDLNGGEEAALLYDDLLEQVREAPGHSRRLRGEQPPND